jgi:hypothetical protein
MPITTPAYLVKVPGQFRRGIRSAADFGKAGRKPWVRMNQGQNRILALSQRPFPGSPSLVFVEPAPYRSIVRKFNPRGQAGVPTVAGQSSILLSFRVPGGMRYQLDGYITSLSPSELNDNNYVWRLFVNGTDLINDGSAQSFPGMPGGGGQYIPLGYDRAEKLIAMPGTLIEAVVTALAPIFAADDAKFSLFGTLYGEGS